MVLILSCIVSTVTYRLIEEPFQQIGKRIIRSREAKQAVPATRSL
jgi:peptidoglycan/LPS O-acetylase OafA/YrhL